MRLSEMAGKELIDVRSGTRMGVLGGADLSIDEETGQIDAILMTAAGFSFGKKRRDAVLPWSSISKIGPDMILLETADERRSFEHAYGTRD